jgi:hypothetical protein
MGRVLAVVDGIPGDPFATERRRNNDRSFARNNQRRKHDGVSFTFVVKYVERMLDRAWSLAVAEIEKQKNDQATAAIDCSIRGIFRFSPCPEGNDHASKRRTGKCELCCTRLRFNGVEGYLLLEKLVITIS